MTFKEGADVYLPQLDSFVSVTKNKEKAVYDFGKLPELLQSVASQIEQVELFYNPYKVIVKNAGDLAVAKNIYTNETLD